MMIECFLFVIFSLINFSDVNTLIWRDNSKLVWDDFKGVPSTSSHYSAESVVTINCEFYYANDTALDVRVHCVFKKNLSWVKPNHMSNYLLKHEQGHFDIGAIYAKQLRIKMRFLNQYNYIHQKNVVGSLVMNHYQNTMADLAAFQHTYDSSTNYSQDVYQQELWNNSIKRMLY